ncbi:DUF3307 domain-containing protein [Mangrovibacterium sp.]|uniref:DUF3307 domain-containing protein n=1 Tax=Mangrovibacterium sp. TaxID=1961364 RepID=UPI003567788B
MILFLRLLMAHLLADFLFQPNSWVADKQKRKIKSAKLFYHIIVVTALSALFTIDLFEWQILLYIFIFHYIIDLAKIYLKPKSLSDLSWFLIDQFFHFVLLFLICLIFDRNLFQFAENQIDVLFSRNSFILLIAYFIIISPSGIIINLATRNWQDQINQGDEPNLRNAGKWIGVLERVLVLTFLLAGQFQAIGFLIAAKSILRFSVKSEVNARIMSEYVLVGTLISFTIAVFVGIATRSLLGL